jgi:hypothetical protein
MSKLRSSFFPSQATLIIQTLLSDSLAILLGCGFRRVGGGGGGGFNGLRRSLLSGGLLLNLSLRYVICENRVQFFRNAQLVLLQLAQTSDHQSILEVTRDTRLKESHVVVGELGHAVFEQAPNTTV